MAPEVHRVVKESDDLHGAGTEPIEQNVPCRPAALGDVEGADPGADSIARLATA